MTTSNHNALRNVPIGTRLSKFAPDSTSNMTVMTPAYAQSVTCQEIEFLANRRQIFSPSC
jgi:hypothetical protein